MSKILDVQFKGENHKVIVDKDLELPRKVFKRGKYYAFKYNNKHIMLHRWVMGIYDKKVQVDHIDGDPKNNTRKNLRVCTHAQNQQNKRSKGYSFHKHTKKWVAQIAIDGKKIHLGYYNTPEEAQQVYRKAHAEAFGEFSPYYNYYHSNTKEAN